MTTENTMPISFGFLPYKFEIQFENGRIIPVPKFDRGLKDFEKRIKKDEYIYPPITKGIEIDSKRNERRTVYKTDYLYPLPPSHVLYISPVKPEPNIREGSAGFIIHLLAYLFGTRLQFSDWWFDGRIPMKRHAYGVPNAVQAGKDLSLAYKVWSGWPEKERKRFTNILYMFSRASVYRQDWEKFIVQYMILDACWKMAEKLFGLRSKTHGERVKKLCDKFSLIQFQEMVALRNDLFHETLWQDGRPGSTMSHIPTLMEHYLNRPLIFGLIKQSLKDQKLI